MKDERNYPLARRMVELELTSTFAFQGNRWLADTVRPILRGDIYPRLQEAKEKAERRTEIEAVIPEDMLYSKGWPTKIPLKKHCQLLAEVRDDPPLPRVEVDTDVLGSGCVLPVACHGNLRRAHVQLVGATVVVGK